MLNKTAKHMNLVDTYLYAFMVLPEQYKLFKPELISLGFIPYFEDNNTYVNGELDFVLINVLIDGGKFKPADVTQLLKYFNGSAYISYANYIDLCGSVLDAPMMNVCPFATIDEETLKEPKLVKVYALHTSIETPLVATYADAGYERQSATCYFTYGSPSVIAVSDKAQHLVARVLGGVDNESAYCLVNTSLSLTNKDSLYRMALMLRWSRNYYGSLREGMVKNFMRFETSHLHHIANHIDARLYTTDTLNSIPASPKEIEEMVHQITNGHTQE